MLYLSIFPITLPLLSKGKLIDYIAVKELYIGLDFLVYNFGTYLIINNKLLKDNK